MKTKDRTKQMDTIKLEDSDCEILDAEISSITIPDSPSTTLNTTAQSDLENTKNITEFDPENLLFEVNFKSADVFNDLKELVVSGLRRTLKDLAGISIVEDDEAIQVYRLPFEERDTTVDEVSVEPVKEEAEDEDDDDADISDMFTVDIKPAQKVNVEQIPSYKRAIKEILDDSIKKKTKTEDECHRPKHTKSCFNCGESDHDLRSCPKPRNNTKINKAKKMHAFKHERYHVDIEQRFAHLRPGKISKNLREALSIRSGELPFFFYRMRALGYPPGWLEDAKVAHSGISLFDSDGRSVRDPEDEDGQVENDKHKYDVNKIIEFPGFNADPGPFFYDDHRHHNVPPLNPEDYREEFIKMLGDNVVKGYKRKKMKDFREGDIVTEPVLDISEMELENEEVSTVANVEFTRPPPPPTPPEDQSRPPLPPTSEPLTPTAPRRSPSPSLEDLEERQKKLLMELQSNVSLISDNDDSLIDDVIELDAISRGSATNTPIKLTVSPVNITESSKDNTQLGNATETSLPQTPMASPMESVLGTPLLKFSPFDKLPNGNNFQVGVSDVINFENLPDSVGTYEKMKDVIKKVRRVVTKLNSEDI